MINIRNLAGGAGTNNAALAFGGYGNPANTDTTELYDGTSWSADVAMSTARNALAGTGTTQGDAMAIGGQTPTVVSCTEEYSAEATAIICTLTYKCNLPDPGVTWAAGGALITARRSLGGAGTQNAALAFAGETPSDSTCTEEYSGESWTAGGAMIIARATIAGGGTQNAAVGFAGTPSNTSTEEYNGTAWAAGGTMITSRYRGGGTGTQNAALAVGGITPSASTATEEYNGSSWATGGALIAANYDQAVVGIQNAALSFGGTPSGTANEEYNGAAWSAGGALITSRFQLMGIGSQNNALAVGGYNSGNKSCVEKYNGTAWSNDTALPTAFRDGDSSNSITDTTGVFFGGVGPAIWANSFESTFTEGACVFLNREARVRCVTGTCTQIS